VSTEADVRTVHQDVHTWQELVALYHLSTPPWSNLEPRYNICPTDTIDVVVRGDDERALVPMRWGLIPSWWKRPLKEKWMRCSP
jgi:putative SOS response-associated peptidase YedK